MGLYHNHRPQAKEIREYVTTAGNEDETYPVKKIATASCPECLNGKYLSLFHLGVVIVLDKWYRFPSVNAILLDVVSSDVAHSLDRKRPTIDVNLIAFHGFLYGSADIANTDIDPRILRVVSGKSSIKTKNCLP